MNKPQRKNVLVCLAYAYGEAHEKYRGLIHYLTSENERWNIMTPYGRGVPSAADLAAAKRNNLDGIIIDLNIVHLQPRHLTGVFKAGVPVVCVESDATLRGFSTPIAHVRSCDEEIGVMAADHLASIGSFSSFAFIGCQEGEWSTRRCNAFIRRLAKLGKPTPQILADGFGPMTQFLRQLKKPCAIFAVADYVATGVIDEARRLGLEVPGDLAIIGVDNEQLICMNTDPTLTSIRPNFFREGFVAAGLLSRMMRGLQVRTVPECRGAKLFVRGTTGPSGPGGRLVQQIQDRLSAQFAGRINVDEIACALNVSRRLLDKRYRQFTGESVMKTVERLRVEKMKELLMSTNASIAEIAATCGFPSTNFMRRIFLRHYHTTPLAFRKRHSG